MLLIENIKAQALPPASHAQKHQMTKFDSTFYMLYQSTNKKFFLVSPITVKTILLRRDRTKYLLKAMNKIQTENVDKTFTRSPVENLLSERIVSIKVHWAITAYSTHGPKERIEEFRTPPCGKLVGNDAIRMPKSLHVWNADVHEL